jgi:hypothetical protein
MQYAWLMLSSELMAEEKLSKQAIFPLPATRCYPHGHQRSLSPFSYIFPYLPC